jgi:hypothetical protein
VKGKANMSGTWTRLIGAFTVTEVETAFGLSQGSLKWSGEKWFDKLSKKTNWTEYWGISIVVERLNFTIGISS